MSLENSKVDSYLGKSFGRRIWNYYDIVVRISLLGEALEINFYLINDY